MSRVAGRTLTGAALTALLAAAPLTQAGPISETPGNVSFATAQNVDSAFTLGPKVTNIEASATTNISAFTRHVSIAATGDDTNDFFAFTVPTPGLVGIFDIDDVVDPPGGGVGNIMDSVLTLRQTATSALAQNDDSLFRGPGDRPATGVPTLESFIGPFTFTNAGTYVIEVSDAFEPGIPDDAGYTLHIQLYDPNAIPAIPEPGTLLLLGAGALGAGLARRRTRRG